MMKSKIAKRIVEVMNSGVYYSVAELSRITGIRQVDVLKVLNANRLKFLLVVAPLGRVRNTSCYYKLMA